jgi:hypothetical protein
MPGCGYRVCVVDDYIVSVAIDGCSSVAIRERVAAPPCFDNCYTAVANKLLLLHVLLLGPSLLMFGGMCN